MSDSHTDEPNGHSTVESSPQMELEIPGYTSSNNGNDTYDSIESNESPPHHISDISNGEHKRSLCQPTKAMIASKLALEKRKNEINDKDDPFWEKRMGKSERLFRKKYKNSIEKTETTKSRHHNKESVDHVVPLSPSSNLLSPTKATINGSYHSKGESKPKPVSPLPATSHLLQQTRASKLAAVQKSPEPSNNSQPQKGQQKGQQGRHSTGSTNTKRSSPDSSLLKLTAARRAATRAKKEKRPEDPREAGWNNSLNRPDSAPTRHSLGSPSGEEPVDDTSPSKVHVPEKYKDVKSKLHTPTVASVRKMRGFYKGVEGEEEASEEHEAREFPPRRDPVHISWRLLETTAAVRSSRWNNRAQSPPPRLNSRAPPPACHSTPTDSFARSTRGKYDAKDPMDVAKRDPKKKAPQRERSMSAPPRERLLQIAGIVVPPPPVSPPAPRSRPRSPSPQPHTPVTIRHAIGLLTAERDAGRPYDAAELERLTAMLQTFPDSESKKQQRSVSWREEVMPFAQECLITMRGFVPPSIFTDPSPLESLQRDGFSVPLARRITTKQCLWLVREDPESIIKFNPTDLTMKFDYSGQSLDIVETAAIYATLPAHFDAADDEDGRKEKWRETLEYQLKRLMKQKEYKSFPSEQKRHPVYEDQNPVYEHIEDLHSTLNEMQVAEQEEEHTEPVEGILEDSVSSPIMKPSTDTSPSPNSHTTSGNHLQSSESDVSIPSEGLISTSEVEKWRILAWREKAIPYCEDCLQTMRGFVPPHVFFSSPASLQSDGLPVTLAKRVANKKCLWLIRVDPECIPKIPVRDLTMKFDYSGQSLDIVEMAAIYATLPAHFDAADDEDGRKEKWRETLERQLMQLMEEKEEHTLREKIIRSPAYEDAQPLFAQQCELHVLRI